MFSGSRWDLNSFFLAKINNFSFNPLNKPAGHTGECLRQAGLLFLSSVPICKISPRNITNYTVSVYVHNIFTEFKVEPVRCLRGNVEIGVEIVRVFS
jgi:hypothetical protein